MDTSREDMIPNMDPELRKTMVAELERFARVAQDIAKRAKAVPESRDLAAAMFANLASEACTAGHGVMRIAKEITEIEERMELAEFGDEGEDGEYEDEE